jgi:hypothetical protein
MAEQSFQNSANHPGEDMTLTLREHLEDVLLYQVGQRPQESFHKAPVASGAYFAGGLDDEPWTSADGLVQVFGDAPEIIYGDNHLGKGGTIPAIIAMGLHGTVQIPLYDPETTIVVEQVLDQVDQAVRLLTQ